MQVIAITSLAVILSFIVVCGGMYFWVSWRGPKFILGDKVLVANGFFTGKVGYIESFDVYPLGISYTVNLYCGGSPTVSFDPRFKDIMEKDLVILDVEFGHEMIEHVLNARKVKKPAGSETQKDELKSLKK